MLSRLTIGKKLGVALTASVACLTVLSFASLWVISSLGRSLDEAVNSTAKKLDLVGKTRDAFQELKNGMVQDQLAYAIAHMEGQSAAANKGSCSACHVPAAASERVRLLEAADRVVRDRGGELRRLVSDPISQKALGTLDSGASRWVDDSKQYLSLASTGRFEEAHSILMDKMDPILAEAEGAAKQLTEREGEALSAANQQAHAVIARSYWIVLFLAGLDLFAAGAMFWLVFRITAALRRIVNEIGKGADQVNAAAGQISAASQSLAQGTSEQASSLEETAASSDEIRSMARSNNEKSRQASELVAGSQQMSTEAVGVVQHLEEAMKQVDCSSTNIADVMRVIEEIAFQTNILALNAAVEAARAGGAGQGFAVVADEVRALAQRCGQAALDTSGLIEESNRSCGEGKVRVSQVSAFIRATAERSVDVRKLVEDVNQSSQQQTRGIEVVARSVEEMSRVTQRNAANAEQNAAAGQELNGLSESLRSLVGELSVMVYGGRTAPG